MVRDVCQTVVVPCAKGEAHIRAVEREPTSDDQTVIDALELRAAVRRLVASFNRGYRGFQQSYRTCTPAADIVIRRYLEEGSRIAREVTARYGN